MTQKKFSSDAESSLHRRSALPHPEQKQVVKQAQKEELRRLSMNFPDSLHLELKLFSVKRRRDMTSVVIEAVKEYLSKHSGK